MTDMFHFGPGPKQKDYKTDVELIRSEIGIIVDGNKSALGASTGQYVILQNSTITGKTDGLYKAASAIPANTAITGSYLTAVSGGLGADVAALNSNITNLFAYKEFTISHGNIVQYGTKTGNVNISVSGYTPFAIRSYSCSDDHMILYECSMTSLVFFYKVKNYDSSAISDASTTVRIAYVKSPAIVSELT